MLAVSLSVEWSTHDVGLLSASGNGICVHGAISIVSPWKLAVSHSIKSFMHTDRTSTCNSISRSKRNLDFKWNMLRFGA